MAWRPTGRPPPIDIDYSWTEKPGIELLGQCITFADRADPELAKIIARLEKSLPRELEKLYPRARLARDPIPIPALADFPALASVPGLAKAPAAAPALTTVKARFGRPTIYATIGGRVAIGLPIRASAAGGTLPTRGTVWLTGIPWNSPNSPVVRVRSLTVTGRTDRVAGDLLIRIAQSPLVIAQLESALAQDFAGELAKLQVKIDRALTAKRLGDFVLDARITSIRYGVLQPLGQGAYLPVEIAGEGRLRWDPAPEVRPYTVSH